MEGRREVEEGRKELKELKGGSKGRMEGKVMEEVKEMTEGSEGGEGRKVGKEVKEGRK